MVWGVEGVISREGRGESDSQVPSGCRGGNRLGGRARKAERKSTAGDNEAGPGGDKVIGNDWRCILKRDLPIHKKALLVGFILTF